MLFRSDCALQLRAKPSERPQLRGNVREERAAALQLHLKPIDDAQGLAYGKQAGTVERPALCKTIEGGAKVRGPADVRIGSLTTQHSEFDGSPTSQSRRLVWRCRSERKGRLARWREGA